MGQSVPDWLAEALDNPGEGDARLAVAGLAQAGMAGRGGFALSSAAFRNGGELDPCFTASEEDAVAPPLEWSAPPSGAMELALIVEDADAPAGKPACHWLVWGLPAQRAQILEGETPPRVGKNAFGNSEWLLPDPPLGDEPHRYVFQLFALDLPLTLMPGASREDLIAAMDGHVLAVALLTGTFARDEGDDLEWEEFEDEDAD